MGDEHNLKPAKVEVQIVEMHKEKKSELKQIYYSLSQLRQTENVISLIRTSINWQLVQIFQSV